MAEEGKNVSQDMRDNLMNQRKEYEVNERRTESTTLYRFSAPDLSLFKIYSINRKH